MNVRVPCLCLVTDRHQCDGRPITDVVASAVQGGVGMVQLREKDLPARELLLLAERLRDITAGKALLFVNDRVDVALACDADGVQLGEEGLPLDATRRVSDGKLLLSRSVHSVRGAVEAQMQGADILIVGTVFPTGSHPGVDAAGVKLLEEVRQHVKVPFLAIGGIKLENVESVIMGGASGAAVITAITRSTDPGQASLDLRDRINNAWSSMRKDKM